MTCNDVRKRLTAGDARGDEALRVGEHLGSCASCASYARRVQGVRRLFREHHAGLQPDPSFATRVARELRPEPQDLLAWAAVRMLPATAALLAVLIWLSVQTTTAPAALLDESPTDDLLSWVIEAPENP